MAQRANEATLAMPVLMAPKELGVTMVHRDFQELQVFRVCQVWKVLLETLDMQDAMVQREKLVELVYLVGWGQLGHRVDLVLQD